MIKKLLDLFVKAIVFSGIGRLGVILLSMALNYSGLNWIRVEYLVFIKEIMVFLLIGILYIKGFNHKEGFMIASIISFYYTITLGMDYIAKTYFYYNTWVSQLYFPVELNWRLKYFITNVLGLTNGVAIIISLLIPYIYVLFARSEILNDTQRTIKQAM